MLPGATVPLFSARDNQGVERGTQVHWQRQDQLILLMHENPRDPCSELWLRMNKRAGELRNEDFAAIGVARSPNPPDGALPDPDGSISRRVREALGLETNGGELVLSTRFARVVKILDAHHGDTDAVLEDALEWLRYGQIACEDCSQPLWE